MNNCTFEKIKKRSKVLLVLCSLPVAFEGCLLPSRQNLGKFRHVLSNLANLKLGIATDRNFILSLVHLRQVTVNWQKKTCPISGKWLDLRVKLSLPALLVQN